MATANLFNTTQQSGTPLSLTVDPTSTMGFWRGEDLGSFLQQVDSVDLITGSDNDAELFLFDSIPQPYFPKYMGAGQHMGNANIGNFHGRFIQLSQTRRDGDLSDQFNLEQAWRNRATSAVVARTREHREVRYHTGLLLQPIVDTILQAMAGATGDSILADRSEVTWLPMPRNIDGLRTDRVYVVIHIPFKVDLSKFNLPLIGSVGGGLLQRQCAINAYLDVYPQQDGRIYINVAKTDSVVWTGPFGDIVNGMIESALEVARGPIELMMQTMALLITGLFPVYADDVYFLPGNQMAPPPRDDRVTMKGDAQTGGITVVLSQRDTEGADQVGMEAEQMIETLKNFVVSAFGAFLQAMPGGIFVNSGTMSVGGDFVVEMGTVADSMRAEAGGTVDGHEKLNTPLPPIDSTEWIGSHGSSQGSCCCVCCCEASSSGQVQPVATGGSEQVQEAEPMHRPFPGKQRFLTNGARHRRR